MSDTNESTQIQSKLQDLTNPELSRIYKNLFDTVEGKMILEDLRNRCNCYLPSTEEHWDANKTMFNEGKRAVLLYIETQLKPEIPVDTETQEPGHSHPTEGE